MGEAEEQDPVDFEQALEELEGLVEELEGGELSLEDSLARFERGVQLTRSCQRALKDAERKVQVLVAEAGEESLAELVADEDSGDA